MIDIGLNPIKMINIDKKLKQQYNRKRVYKKIDFTLYNSK